MKNIIRSSQLASENSIRDELVDCPILAVMPSTNMPMAVQAATLMKSRAGVDNFDVLIVEDDAGLGFVEIANLVFQRTNGQFFIYTAQDAFAGRLWLKHALDCIESQAKGLLAFHDGKWAGYLAAFGMVRREWAKQNYSDATLFFSGYESHYADTELTLLALQAGQHCFDPYALLIEVDWEKDKKVTNSCDKNLFALRKSLRFDSKVSSPDILNLFR